MSETNRNDEGAARAGAPARPREDGNELKAEQESAEAMDADVPHPSGSEEKEKPETKP